MPRTVVISDLHLGAYSQLSVLEQPAVAAALCERLADFDQLVLLGDALELGERRPPAEVLAAAGPFLAGAGAAVDEVVLVPGNHDHLLIRDWLADQGDQLALENVIVPDASPLLAQTTERLGSGGARVSVRYAGFALSDTVWMTHGHYLDRLLSPEIPYGLLRHPPRHTPAAYENPPRSSRRGGPVHRAIKLILRPGASAFTAAGLDMQMRRHSMPALAGALSALGVRSEHVVFGHVHRLGPLPGDRPADWQFSLAPGGPATRFWNTGSWQNDPLLIRAGRRPHAYWPGGAVVIESDGVPRAVRLLEGAELGPAFER